MVAVWLSSGTDSTLPRTTPAKVPASAGIPACATYAATTWAGVKPMLLSTPIRRYPLTTAPLTTLPTISTDIASPMTPNATMNGTMIAIDPLSWLLTVSQELVPVIVPDGSARVRAVTSASSCGWVSAWWNRYSICAAAGACGGRSVAICAGSTQPSAVSVNDLATPTTVSFGCPGALVTMIWLPMSCAVRPGLGKLRESTISPGRRAHRPASRVRSSTGPPGEARPATVTGGSVMPPWVLIRGVMVASANGPAAAMTCGSPRVAASWPVVALDESMLAATSAPRCAANECWNGLLEEMRSPSPSVAEAVDTSRTVKITTVCTLRRVTPPDTARTTGLTLIAVLPRSRRWRSGRQRPGSCGWRTGRPGLGCG